MNDLFNVIIGLIIGTLLGIFIYSIFNIKNILTRLDIIDIKDNIDWCFFHDELFLKAWDEYFFNLSSNILNALLYDNMFYEEFIKEDKYKFLSRKGIYTGSNNYHLDNIWERKRIYPISGFNTG